MDLARTYPEVKVKVVFVDETLPDEIKPYREHIIHFPPVEDVPVEFTSQYLRLLYPFKRQRMRTSGQCGREAALNVLPENEVSGNGAAGSGGGDAGRSVKRQPDTEVSLFGFWVG